MRVLMHNPSTELGKLRVSFRIGHRLSVNLRSLLVPGLGLLDLRGKLEQQVFLSEAADKLYADRQARLRPGERQADTRLAASRTAAATKPSPGRS
jgi:hypothetical protein